MRLLIAIVLCCASLTFAADQRLAVRVAAIGVDVDTNQRASIMPQADYTNCLLWLPFSVELTAGTYHDFSALHYDGSQANSSYRPVYTNGWGGAYTFDGVDDRFTTTTQIGSSLRYFTISMWLKWSHSDAWEAALGYLPSAPSPTAGTEIDINRRGDTLANSPGDVGFYIRDDDAKVLRGGTVGKSYNDGTWRHFAWVFTDTANDVPLFYVNGILTSQTIHTDTDPATYSAFVEAMPIGCRTLGSVESKFFNGTLDDVRFYDVGLSSNKVLAIYMKEPVLANGGKR